MEYNTSFDTSKSSQTFVFHTLQRDSIQNTMITIAYKKMFHCLSTDRQCEFCKLAQCHPGKQNQWLHQKTVDQCLHANLSMFACQFANVCMSICQCLHQMDEYIKQGCHFVPHTCSTTV